MAALSVCTRHARDRSDGRRCGATVYAVVSRGRFAKCGRASAKLSQLRYIGRCGRRLTCVGTCRCAGRTSRTPRDERANVPPEWRPDRAVGCRDDVCRRAEHNSPPPHAITPQVLPVIAPTVLTAGNSLTNGATYTTSSINPAPNTLVTVAVLGIRTFGASPSPTVTGGGMSTWTEAGPWYRPAPGRA